MVEFICINYLAHLFTSFDRHIWHTISCYIKKVENAEENAEFKR